jgi:hypothetical protein
MWNRVLAGCVLGVGLLLVGSAPRCEPVRPGVEVGLTYSFPDFDVGSAVLDKSGVTSFAIGGFIEIPLGDWRSFVPGLRYIRRGHSVKFDTEGTGKEGWRAGDVDIDDSYLSVPILLKVTLVDRPRLFFKAGPDVLWLLSAHANGRESIEDDFVKIIPYEDKDISGDLRPVTFSVDLGGGVEFQAGQHTASIEARYDYGVDETARAGRFFSNWQTSEVELVFGLTW